MSRFVTLTETPSCPKILHPWMARLWYRLQPLAVSQMPLDVPPPRSNRFGSPLGLVATSVPKVTLRNACYINELFDGFCYKQLKSMNILLLST
jgi:hypothetical protein